MRISPDHWLLTRPIAHRGLHCGTETPENSLAACDAAITVNAPIEVDILMTRDAMPIIFHDTHLGRLTGSDRLVADTDYEHIATLTLYDSAQPIPTLPALLAHIDGQVPLLIEIKPGVINEAHLDAIAALLLAYRGDYAVQSFNPHILRWFRRHHPAIVRGQLAAKHYKNLPWWKAWLHRHLLICALSQPHFIGFCVDDLPTLATRLARALGLPLLAWTVTDTTPPHRVRYADNIIAETQKKGCPFYSTDHRE